MDDDAEKQAAELIAELTDVHRGWCEYCKGDGEICERTKDSYRCVVPQTREAVSAVLREAYDQSPERIRTLMAERYGARSSCDILQAEIQKLNAELDEALSWTYTQQR